jgi:hypothetical protein
MLRSRWILHLAVLVPCLALVSCFEPPVLETLDLRFLADGSTVVTSAVQISSPQDGGNPALARRLMQVRRELEEGSDAWGRRFAALEPVAERFGWEKSFGEIDRGTRAALAGFPARLDELFRDTSLDVSYEVRDRVAELTITPASPARASRRQREQVERTLEEWSGHVASYLKESADLWAYLDGRPARARACLGALLADLLDDGVREALPALTEPERERIDRVQQAMEEVLAVLAVPPGEDHSADELSHLVYDPFPARLTVRLPGPPLEAPEGFASTDGGRQLTAVGPGLWEALRSLEGRWLAPDPVLLYVEKGGPGKEEPLDLDAFLTQPRRAASPPNAVEVRQGIEERLLPAPLYRVLFAVDPDAEIEGDAWERFAER